VQGAVQGIGVKDQVPNELSEYSWEDGVVVTTGNLVMIRDMDGVVAGVGRAKQ
jgi:hypothetical protein